MNLRYDKDIDAVYLYLKDNKIAASEVVRSQEVAPGVIYDFDGLSNVVGIEILSVRQRTYEQMKQFYSPLTEEQRGEFRKLCSQLPT